LLYLDFHHHTILVRCNESLLLKKIQQEFHFFVTEVESHPETIIDLKLEASPEMPSMVAQKILENCLVYKLGSRQYVDYFGEALTIWDKLEKNIQIFCQDQSRLYELAFLAIHSILGQELDREAICRLHAVAVSINKVNAVVMLPSKGGKSTLLTALLVNPEVRIISDDMPLCDRHGRIFPFPSKMSLDSVPKEGPLATLAWHEFLRYRYPTKYTASLSQMQDRLEQHSENNLNLLIAGLRLSTGNTILTEVPKWKMITPVLEHMIMGMGLPQVMELFLNFNFTDLFKMMFHAFLRSICAFQLVRKAKCYYIYLGPDKSYNAQLLLDLMYEHQNT